MAMNEYEATVKTTSILEESENKKFLIVGIVIVLLTFILSILIYNYGNDTSEAMAKAGLEQCKLPDESSSRIIWVKSCEVYLKDAKEYAKEYGETK